MFDNSFTLVYQQNAHIVIKSLQIGKHALF